MLLPDFANYVKLDEASMSCFAVFTSLVFLHQFETMKNMATMCACAAHFLIQFEELGVVPKLRPLYWSPWGSVTRPCPFPVCPFPVTGKGHGRVPSPP